MEKASKRKREREREREREKRERLAHLLTNLLFCFVLFSS